MKKKFLIILVTVTLLLTSVILLATRDSFPETITTGGPSFRLDFDGDRIIDRYDQSPCIPGEEIVIATDNKEYFYFADAPTPEAIYEGIEESRFKLSSKQMQQLRKGTLDRCSKQLYDEFFPDISQNMTLIQVKEKETNIELCVMNDDQCESLLKEFYQAINSTA